jgi:CRP-like cAMP-binding protein
MLGGNELFAGAGRRPVLVQRGRVIFAQGDEATAIYRVERGCVRLQTHDKEGSRDVLAFFFPGDVICGGLATHWATAEAVSETIITRFSLVALMDLMRNEPQAAMSLLASAERALDDLARHIGRVVHSSATDRLTWFLTWISQRTATPSSGFELPMNRRDIADFLGLAPETVSRAFAQLEASGDLRKGQRRQYSYRAAAAADHDEAPARARA